MKKILSILVALCLVVCLTFSGCGVLDLGGYLGQLADLIGSNYLTDFDDMVYTRPDMENFQSVLDKSLQEATSQKRINKLVDAIYDFYAVYDGFYTGYALANIHYSLDMSDTKWEEEYNFCLENAAVADAGLDNFYRALAKSPLRETLETDEYFGAGFFDAYEGESLYDENFQAMLSQEAQLQSQYYAISAEAAGVEYYSDAYFTQYGSQMAEVFVDLVELRQDIAAYAGFASYPEFAYAFYFGRDFTCQQASVYLADIQKQLVPLYQQLNASGFWNQKWEVSSQKNTLDYLKTMATNMGGVVENAFLAMEDGGLYDISYSPNKFTNSFEIYISNYYTPYVFLSPTNTVYDKLAFAHEFGHFCADFESMGSAAGVDVAEVFSQGMEYLSLCYVEDPELEKLKMADSLRVYVEQSAYASFEQQVYALQDHELTAENVQKLYEEIGTAYGFNPANWDSRDYVCVPHFFISPMYVLSYVVSNDVAMQLYRMETAQEGSGLTCLTENLTTQHAGIQAFVQEAGLESPFAPGSIQEVRNLLASILFAK